jgi:hypothetical protein
MKTLGIISCSFHSLYRSMQNLRSWLSIWMFIGSPVSPTKSLSFILNSFLNIAMVLYCIPRHLLDAMPMQSLLAMPMMAALLYSMMDIVGVHNKNAKEKGGKDRSLCCVSYADKTGVCPVSCKHVNTRYTKIGPHGQTTWTKDMKQHHVDKRYAHVDKRYARNMGESSHVSTRLKHTDSS